MDICETERSIKFIKDHFETALRSTAEPEPHHRPAVRAGRQRRAGQPQRRREARAASPSGPTGTPSARSCSRWRSGSGWRCTSTASTSGEGIYTDMNALRPDEESLDNIHSVYVDQWDWERVIRPEDRNLDTSRPSCATSTPPSSDTEAEVAAAFPSSSRSCRTRSPSSTPRTSPRNTPTPRAGSARAAACREHGAVFFIGIGGELPDGKIHDGRAPDYDDWTTPTGDGARGPQRRHLRLEPVAGDPASNCRRWASASTPRPCASSLRSAAARSARNCPGTSCCWTASCRRSIGGGIGQSRLCMLLLQRAHIGEVQVGIWPQDVHEACKAAGITLL